MIRLLRLWRSVINELGFGARSLKHLRIGTAVLIPREFISNFLTVSSVGWFAFVGRLSIIPFMLCSLTSRKSNCFSSFSVLSVCSNLTEPIQLHLRTTNCLKRWGKGKIGQNQLPLTSIGQGPLEVDIFNENKFKGSISCSIEEVNIIYDRSLPQRDLNSNPP